MYHDNWWGMPMTWFIGIPILIILIVVIIRLLDNIKGDTRKDSPLYILKKRYARGEITKEEYEERRRVVEEE